jgi:hypothetical protein
LKNVILLKDTNNDEPVKAHMPTWANNPDYTQHATTTKPDDTQHKPVFEIFDGRLTDKPAKPVTAAEPPVPAPRSSSESDAAAVKKEATKKPTTQL